MYNDYVFTLQAPVILASVIRKKALFQLLRELSVILTSALFLFLLAFVMPFLMIQTNFLSSVV